MQDTTASKPNASALAWDWRARLVGDAGRAAQAARDVAHARKRGAIGLVVGLAVAVGIFYFLHSPRMAAVVAGVSGLLALLALLFPLTLYRQVMRGLDRFAHGVGVAVTWASMTLVYFLLFLPVGLALRAGKKLGITRHFDPAADSYWSQPKERAATLDSYRRQF
jgi:hypothetical protein